MEITKEELVALRNSNHAELTDEELENVSVGYSWGEFWDDVKDGVLTALTVAEMFSDF